MTPFLKLVAEDILITRKIDTSKSCVVFPNRRALLYFNKYLSELVVEKPIWAPRYVTINDLMQDLSGLQVADNVQLLFELYKSYIQIRKTGESFDHFYYWGEVMLSDFDDTDKYLIDAEQLFNNIADLKEISDKFPHLSDEQKLAIQNFWGHLQMSKQSDELTEFNHLWNDLYSIYQHFKASLIAQNIGYEGQVYRQVTQIDKTELEKAFKYDQYLFVGFNALNECEHFVLNFLNKRSKALFYWDYDTIYSQNPIFEAGRFISENLLRYPSALDGKHFSNYTSKEKLINIYTLSSNTGQANVLGDILEQFEINNSTSQSETAILLCDEKLLMPVLQALPDTIEDLNVTMGYPIRNLPVVSLVEDIGNLWRKPRMSHSKAQFYYKNVSNILNNQYLSGIEKNLNNEILQKIKKNNFFLLNESELATLPYSCLIFTYPESIAKATDNLLSLLMFIARHLESNSPKTDTIEIDIESIYLVYTEINKIKDIVATSNIAIDISTWSKIVTKSIQNLSIPFKGEPLSGMQLMGFLESRTLDFKNLILVSMNEGIMPKTDQPLTFIPYNLRYGYGLPTIDFRTAMYAYYFYRVVQRAEKIAIIFNNQPSQGSGSELSRFATQLIFESPHKINQFVYGFDLSVNTRKCIIIEKNEELQQILEKFLIPEGRTLSPKAINTFIDCSLQFYFRYIKGLKEPDEITEEIDPRILGLLLHKSLEIIYEPYLGKNLYENFLNEKLQTEIVIEQALLKAFSIEYFKTKEAIEIEQILGRNLIIFNILKKYISQILAIDKKEKKLVVEKMEEKIIQAFTFNHDGQTKQVRLSGYIDRVDRIDTQFRIVDYKTSGIKKNINNLNQLFDSESKDRNKEMLQVILYSWMYSKQNGQSTNITPAFYDVRNIFEKDFDPTISINNQTLWSVQTVENEVESQLSSVFQLLFDSKIPFQQTEIIEKCLYCAYKEICSVN